MFIKIISSFFVVIPVTGHCILSFLCFEGLLVLVTAIIIFSILGESGTGIDLQGRTIEKIHL